MLNDFSRKAVDRRRRLVLSGASAALSVLLLSGSAVTVFAQDNGGPAPQQSGAPTEANGDYNGPPAHEFHGGSNNHHIPSGTPLKVRILRNLGSATAQPGDTVRVEVAGDDTTGIPPGTIFVGHVTAVHPATPNSAGSLSIQLELPRGSWEEQHREISSASVPGPIADDASVTLTGTTPHKAGHTTGIAAVAGGLLGFVRKGKLGDLIEGGAIGAVAGTAIDQSQKRSSSDVNLGAGDELPVRLDRGMIIRTEVIPEDSE